VASGLFGQDQDCRAFRPLRELFVLTLFGMRHKFFLPPISLCGFIFVSVLAQLLLKIAGSHSIETERIIDAWLLNPYLGMALVCYGASFVCWMRVLKILPLSSAYPWTALIYVLTPMAAVWLWQEPLSVTYLAGMVCVLCGIGITIKAQRMT
jgi:undecaprenyl phosphate-alpha-L-ara4N flippase subunit ArnE